MFNILFQTARGILNSLICVTHFSNNFNSVFHKKKVKETHCCSRRIACKENRTDWILTIITLDNKNPLYLRLKPFGVPQTLRILSLKAK